MQQAAYQTQTDIVAAAADALAIPAGADLDQIGKIAQIGEELISDSKERMLLEESTTDAALPLLRGISDVPLFAENNIKTNSGVCTLVAAYAQEKLDYFPNAVLLLGMIEAPTEILPDDVASMVNCARLAIYEVAADLLSKNGHEATLSQLKNFAHAIHPLKKDGSDTEQLETVVNTAALTKINNSEDAVEMADAYRTKSGSHRVLMSYLANLDGKPFTQNDLDMIVGAVRAMGFGGAEVFTKLGQLAEQHDLDFDEREAMAKMKRSGIPSGLGALLSALSGSRSGEVVFSSPTCNCVNCQIKRLISEDSKNTYLTGEWEEAKLKLSEAGVLIIRGERDYTVIGGPNNLEQAMEDCGICDTLREILRKQFDRKESSGIPDGIPPEIAALAAALGETEKYSPFADFPGQTTVVDVVLEPTSSAEKFRDELEKHLQKGDLATYKFLTTSGPMTVKDMAAVDSNEANAELQAIAKEYAAKVE